MAISKVCDFQDQFCPALVITSETYPIRCLCIHIYIYKHLNNLCISAYTYTNLSTHSSIHIYIYTFLLHFMYIPEAFQPGGCVFRCGAFR